MLIVGLSGKAGTGKDYLATTYMKPLGFHPISMAWHMKLAVVGKGLASYDEVFKTKPPEVRRLLQEEGTERGRKVWGEDVWCNTTMAWIRLINEQWGVDRFVIPDIRFPNELAMVKSAGGHVWRLIAPVREASNGLSAQARQHESEIALDGYDFFDAYISNNPADVDKVGVRVAQLVSALLASRGIHD
jgi:hypothetical protein